MKRVVLCADDYAIAPGVSRGIRELVALGRLNATSVMTVFEGLPEAAPALDAACAGRAVSIGLHVTLTGGFAPLTAPAARFPTLSGRLIEFLTGRLDRAALAAEVEAQFATFQAVFGRPPDHVDGHQHVHVLPGVRDVVIAAAARHAPGAWLRDVRPAAPGLDGPGLKARLIGAFGAGFPAAAARARLRTSGRFAGAYDFSAGSDFAALLRRFLAGLPEGGLAMVHPGHVDATLAARDPVTDQRAREYAVLASDAFPGLLASAGVRLF
ncbi:ChbG/HpnK family deacetylase [Xanthobacter pseudotagetidis]|uniref:ChbG/HpnK family deacetylase n=1 Tax=Xanthobacter pseudotagetidis TaxID=3119911 RepID=UPI003728AB9C